MKQILLFALLFTGSLAHAQIPLGFKAGINLSDVTYKNTPATHPFGIQTDIIILFHAGISAKIKVNDKLSLIPELQYIQKGMKSPMDDDARIKFNYIEFPLLASYKLFSIVAIEAGPSLGFNISTNVSYDVNTLDAGLLGGLRLYLSNRFELITRYCHGLSVVDEIRFYSANGNNGIKVKGYNKSFQLSAVYYLN